MSAQLHLWERPLGATGDAARINYHAILATTVGPGRASHNSRLWERTLGVTGDAAQINYHAVSGTTVGPGRASHYNWAAHNSRASDIT